MRAVFSKDAVGERQMFITAYYVLGIRLHVFLCNLHSSPVKKGLFSLHRRGENEARSQTAGRNALAAVNPEGAERQALSKSSQLPSPKPLVGCWGHQLLCAIW